MGSFRRSYRVMGRNVARVSKRYLAPEDPCLDPRVSSVDQLGSLDP